MSSAAVAAVSVERFEGDRHYFQMDDATMCDVRRAVKPEDGLYPVRYKRAGTLMRGWVRDNDRWGVGAPYMDDIGFRFLKDEILAMDWGI